ncbi:MAG TPA: transporter substrate-binding domain-containing protein [Spirochaetota bacterium]|nr:transporter substrate-binding domain-containing protein [Spirochaetota bacterium]HPJ43826.1 transporter substrate-binding domain-containing protein [Spirochaetota bacterium]HPR39050.1 transporter substrate-binding domain-containing protein [Spirochaetota bacterium]HRX49116.1 transporter substrate-binding domain-containing protein [Spirochaetota bacterium]
MKSRLFILSAILITAFSIPVFADDKTYIADFETWAPFRIADSSSPGGFKGLDIEILNEISEKLNIKIQVRRSPWARSLENIKTGNSDIITGVAYTDERAEFIDYIEPSYYSVNPVFYVQKGKGHLIKNYNDLYSYSIGYSIKSAYFEPFNSDRKLKKVELSTEAQLIRMLVLGRVDVIIGTNPNLAYDLLQSGNSSKAEPVFYTPPKKTRLYIGLSKKSQLKGRKKEIEKVLKDMIKNKKIKKIMTEYR